MGLSPLTFTGISQYSQDFQTILQRVTTIASFPLNQLKNEKADIATKRQLTNELNGSVELFGKRLAELRDIAGQRAISASSSSSKVSVTSVTADAPNSYQITEVSSIAKAASETSTASFANSSSTQVSASGNLRLTLGASTYNFSLSPAENNLVGLRNKINGLNAGVTASILTVGAGENYLSVAANGAGAKTLSLNEDPSGVNTALLTTANQGSNLNFKLNGVSVSRPFNQVNDLVPGVAFTINQTTVVNESISINLTSDRSKLSNAISGFVDAYNALQSKVGQQVGEKAGLLSGDVLVREAQEILRKSSGFGLGAGLIKNWSDLGVSFEQSGAITLDSAIFNALSEAQITDSFNFFGGTTGLGSLTSRSDGFTDAINGMAKLQINQYDRTDSRLTNQISSLEDRIEVLRSNYLQKLQVADALLGNLESQKNIVGASIDSLNLVLYGKRGN